MKRDARRRLRRRLRRQQRVVLVALGLWPNGRHQVLAWALALLIARLNGRWADEPWLAPLMRKLLEAA